MPTPESVTPAVHWQRLRERKIAEAGGKCQLCSAGGALNLHHRTYERQGHERDDDVIVLCCSCHGRFHRHGNGKTLRRPEPKKRERLPGPKGHANHHRPERVAGAKQNGTGANVPEFPTRDVPELLNEFLLTQLEVARCLRVAPSVPYQLHRVGALPGVKVSGSLRWKTSDVRAYAEGLGEDE